MLQKYQSQLWLRTGISHGIAIVHVSMLLIFILFVSTSFGTQPAYAEEAQATPTQANEILAPISAVLADQINSEINSSSAQLSFLVILDEQLDAQQILQTDNLFTANSVTRADTIYRQLAAHALRTQAPLRAWLDANHIHYTPFYLVNMIEVEGDPQVVAAIRRFQGIDRLEANPRVKNALEVASNHSWLRELSLPQLAAAPAATQEIPYGLAYSHADQVWALGYTGQGIVVASQDTGVEWDQPALMPAYRGYISATNTISHTYNWFDAIDGANRPLRCDSNAAVPCDDTDHGTHTVGTMVGDATALGDTVLGMAPSAQWIACRNMDNGFGTPAWYTACFEFMLAPYPQGGDKFSQGRPELAPQVINNSWGCPPSEGCDVNSLRQIVETVRAAGIMVVASAGNNGSSCYSVSQPIAMHDATFTVGAHSSSGTIASFSSRGPVSSDGSFRRKPDISAPGVSVRSAGFGNDVNVYKSGTSMASPHVAGAVALLYSAAPALIGNPDLTEQVLIKSATPVEDSQCPISQVDNVPNNVYGFGRLNVLAAVQMAQNPATIAVTLANCSEQPVPNQPVQLIDTYTTFVYSTTTDANGLATFPTVYAAPGDAIPITDTFTLQATSATTLIPTSTVALAAGSHLTLTLTAQECDLAGLGNFVWLDENQNGVQDTNESGMAGVEADLYDLSDSLIVSQTTGADGRYDFIHLDPGSYSLRFQLPVGFTATQQDIGNDAQDSDVDPQSLRTVTFTLAANVVDQNWDLGVVQHPTALNEGDEPGAPGKIYLPFINR